MFCSLCGSGGWHICLYQRVHCSEAAMVWQLLAVHWGWQETHLPDLWISVFSFVWFPLAALSWVTRVWWKIRTCFVEQQAGACSPRALNCCGWVSSQEQGVAVCSRAAAGSVGVACVLSRGWWALQCLQAFPLSSPSSAWQWWQERGESHLFETCSNRWQIFKHLGSNANLLISSFRY